MSAATSGLSTPVESVRKLIARVILVIVAIVALTVITIMGANYLRKSRVPTQQQVGSRIPLASMPKADWPKLAMEPGGKSEKIPVPVGMKVVMSGEGFAEVCVYGDEDHKSEFVTRSADKPCLSGDLRFAYAKNDLPKDRNIVSYAYTK